MKLTRFLIGLALLATGLVALSGAPANAAVRTLTTSYTCTATHSVLGELASGTASITITVNLPRQVTLGKKLAARPINFGITVPEEMVTKMRDDYGVDAVSGSSSNAHYRLKKGTAPAIKKAITGLAIPETTVPPSGSMLLTGSGTASGHTFKSVGDWKVLVPNTFTAAAVAHGVDGFGDQPFTLDCTLATGALTKTATIKVLR